MGKGAARFGGKSGILPPARVLLKNPTIRQKPEFLKAFEEENKNVKTGYAANIAHPRGSSREQQPIEFVNVEKLIEETVPEPTSSTKSTTAVGLAKANMAALRREYLRDLLRSEESRLLKQQELLVKKREYLKTKDAKEQAALLKSVSIDGNLTTPTLHDMLSYLPKDGGRKRTPLMRQRSSEETEVLNLKRQHNRELLDVQHKERKLEELLRLYHVSEKLIVTEKDLSKYVDEVFQAEPNMIVTKYNTIKQVAENEEAEVINSLFGVVNRTSSPATYVGLPKTTEYLNGEMTSFLKAVEQKIKDVSPKTE